VAKFPTLHPLRTEDISPQELMLASTYPHYRPPAPLAAAPGKSVRTARAQGLV
jgi:hypothetical protein